MIVAVCLQNEKLKLSHLLFKIKTYISAAKKVWVTYFQLWIKALRKLTLEFNTLEVNWIKLVTKACSTLFAIVSNQVTKAFSTHINQQMKLNKLKKAILRKITFMLLTLQMMNLSLHRKRPVKLLIQHPA